MYNVRLSRLRRYEINGSFGDLQPLADEVIECLVDEKVGVLDLQNVFVDEFEREFPLDILERSQNQIRILDWLPVVVNGIGFAPLCLDEYQEIRGHYESNLHLSVLPNFPGVPVTGPDRFTGRILMDSLYQHSDRALEFQAFFAHELIHAIRTMTFVVAAVQDWTSYRANILPDADRWKAIERFIVAAIDTHTEIDMERYEMIRFFGNDRGTEWNAHLTELRRMGPEIPHNPPLPPQASFPMNESSPIRTC